MQMRGLYGSTRNEEGNTVVASGGLKKWFGEKWVNIGAKPKNGVYPPCGRKKAKKSRKVYPKCVPASKAARMTKSEKRSAVRRKRAKAQGVRGKPTMVRTFAKKKRGRKR